MGLVNATREDRWPFVITIAIIAILTGAAGCQLDVSGAIGGKVFYPNSAGSAKVGDPRMGQYEPGHTETNSAGQYTGTTLLLKAPPAGEDPKGGE
jgi:hypothetical protein